MIQLKNNDEKHTRQEIADSAMQKRQVLNGNCQTTINRYQLKLIQDNEYDQKQHCTKKQHST